MAWSQNGLGVVVVVKDVGVTLEVPEEGVRMKSKQVMFSQRWSSVGRGR